MAAWRRNEPVSLDQKTLGQQTLSLPDPASHLLLINAAGEEFLVSGPLRLTLAGNQAVQVRLATAAPADGPDRVPMGTEGVVLLPAADGRTDIAVQLVVAESSGEIVNGQRVPTVAGGLQPSLVPSAEGPVIGVRVVRPGVSLSDATGQQKLVACIIPAGGTDARRTDIISVKPEVIGAATLTLRLSDDMLKSTTYKWQAVTALVADQDGKNARWGVVWTLWGPIAAVIAGIVVLAFYFILAKVIVTRASRLNEQKTWNVVLGLFAGRDNIPSLSLFQVFLWTMVTMWALLYVLLLTFAPVILTEQIMALLGLSGATSVAARWINSNRTPGITAPIGGDVQDFWAMVMTDEKPDLLKIQLFSFTLFAVGYVLVRVTQTAAFPVLDTNLLLLMGVSNLTYLGGKVAEPAPADRAKALQSELDTAKKEVKRLEDRLAELDTEKKEKETTLATTISSEEKSNLATRIKEIGEEIVRLKGRAAADGTPAVEGDIKKAQAKRDGLEKSLKDVLAGVKQ
jgi:hypothetical protein